MKRCPPLRIAALIAALLVPLLAVSAFAQFQTGNIYGNVQAKDGSMLPGVTVTLSGPTGTSTFVTDSSGAFRFIALSPGEYNLTAELAGFGKATRNGVRVAIGQNADVTISLAPAASESITVTAEAPLLDVRKAGTAINVTKVELEAIPTSRDPWTILQQSPGVLVDRMNVGGNQSGQQSVYIGKGASTAQNTWNVDGVNITDMGATGSSPTYYDFDAFEEMQITTGGSDPRIQTPGVQLNMVTKRGTNDFLGGGRYFYTPGSYQADASVPEEAQAYLSHTNEVNYVRDYGADVGGPIWKDKLWFWGAYAENKISIIQAARVGAVDLFDNIILKNKNAKINAQLMDSNSGVFFYDFGDKIRNARSLGPQRPFETTWKQTGPSAIYKLEDTQIIGSSLYLTGMASKVTGGFRLDPNGGLGPSAPNTWRDTSNVWHNNFLFYNTDRPQKQYRLDGSKFIDIANMNHEFKFGFGYRDTPVESSSGFPGDTQGYWRFRVDSYCTARDLAVGCAQGFLYRDSNKEMSEKMTDLYIGDTILLGNLTIQAGLRYDQQKGKNEPSVVTANPVIGTAVTVPGCEPPTQCALPAINYQGDARELEWKTISPRLGLTYSLGGDKKSLIRAGYNRYANQLGSTILSANLFTYYQYFWFLGHDTNGDRKIQRNELERLQGFNYLDPSNPASSHPTTRLDYDMNAPKTDEFIIGYERELTTDFSIGVNFTHRKYTDLLEERFEKTQGRGDFYTRNDYELAGQAGGPFTDPYSGQVTNLPTQPYYLLKSGVPVPVFSVIRNRPDYHQTFNGLELSATKRLTNKWMMRGNVSWNDWKEHSGPDSFADPTRNIPTVSGANQTWCRGECDGQVVERSAGSGAFANVFINSKWSFSVTGLYELPWQTSVGASFTGRQGYPMVYRDQTTIDNGVNDVVIEDVGDRRFDNVYNLDLRLAKEFRFMDRLGLTISADLFNVLNERTVMQRDTLLFFDKDESPSGNEISELQSPRIWRFGAKLTF